MEVKYKNYIIRVNFDIVAEEYHEDLKELYISIFKIFEELEKIVSAQRTLLLSEKLECIEFEIQKLFNLAQNKDYHRYWLKIPTCTCPKLDNFDYYGTEIRLFSDDCPIHGNRIRNLIKRKKKLKRIINSY